MSRSPGTPPDGSDSSSDQPTSVERGQPISAQDRLPPVRPPSAAFLMQLFFIPMIIVTIIVAVWLLFSWVAHLGTRPEDLVRNLQQLDTGSWQQAVTLAQLLRDPGREQLRQDRQLAQSIADILDRELNTELTPQDELNRTAFRIYLCRALGEFEVPIGVPVLTKAAVQERSTLDVPVRRAALQAISLLAGRLGGPVVRHAHPDVMDALITSSSSLSDDPQQYQLRGQLRSTAAFALGLVGGTRAEQALGQMLGDPYPDARYNAALGLARHGNAAAGDRLIEMLNPDNQALAEVEGLEALEPSVTRDQQKQMRKNRIEWKRSLVLRNALRAVRQLAERNPSAVSTTLVEAVNELHDADLDRATQLEWNETVRTLRVASGAG